MNKSGIIGEAIEQLGGVAKQAGKTLAQTPGSLVKGAASQVAGSLSKPGDTGTEASTQQAAKQDDTVDVVKSLYGIKPVNNQSTGLSNNSQVQNPDLKNSPEELQKLASLRKQLHNETYYQPLVKPPKPPEERPAEKIEREKKEEEEKKIVLMEEEKKKEELPLAVSRAKQKAEKFRGVSG